MAIRKSRKPARAFSRPKSLTAKLKEAKAVPPKEKCAHCMGTGFEPDHEAIGKAMRTKRTKAGKAMKPIADKMGIGQSYLSELETGKKSWNADLKKKFEDALKEETAAAEPA